MSDDQLFKLTPEEQQLTGRLQTIIREEIAAAGGVIPFNRYMELALYYPGLGYYSNPLFKFGAKGDFVTAPMISNLFGHLLARQLQELIAFGCQPRLLEFGAGNGKLAADILASMGDNLECYWIVELSADLQQWQRETLQEKVPQHLDKVRWLNALPDQFDGIILANEVLDAIPCELIKINPAQINGVGVAYTDNSFVYRDYQLSPSSLEYAQNLNLNYSNYQTEIHLPAVLFMESVAKMLRHGAILFIDYGYGANEYYQPSKTSGTLRGFYRQQVLDGVLVNPGLIDITTSVNWSAIATAAIKCDCDFIGYTNQAGFLVNCGLTALMDQLHNELSAAQYLQLSNQINRLISPNEMGINFKVAGFSKALEQDEWLGFSDYDLSYAL